MYHVSLSKVHNLKISTNVNRRMKESRLNCYHLLTGKYLGISAVVDP